MLVQNSVGVKTKKFKKLQGQKGAIMIVAVFAIMISIVSMVSMLVDNLFSQKRENLVGEYYQRAIASAISCREAAMARLSRDFHFRTQNTISLRQFLPQIERFYSNLFFTSDPNSFTGVRCSLSIFDADNPDDLLKINSILVNSASSSNSAELKFIRNSDIFVEIRTVGISFLPQMYGVEVISKALRTIVGISYTYPVIIFTEMH